jgi:hypothetical protein
MESPTNSSIIPPNIEDILNNALSQSISCLFTPGAAVPFQGIQFTPEPTITRSPESLPVVPPPTVVESPSWDGDAMFHQSLSRLELSSGDIQRLLASDESILTKYGHDLTGTKRAIKSELKEYDMAYKEFAGIEPGRPEKEPMRPLYNLYRRLRDLVILHDEKSPAEQRLDELYDIKQSIRQVLQDYQTQFMNEQGRRIKYHRDIIAVEPEYRQYKQVKDEIARLEVELGRQPQSRNSSHDFFN